MILFKQLILLFSFLLISAVAFSQCAMCKAVVETDLANGGTVAKGINNGILYLMAFPYLLLMGVGYYFYKQYKKKK